MQPLAFFAILKRKNVNNNNNDDKRIVTSLYKKIPVLEPIDTCMTGIEDLYECVQRMRNAYVNNKELQQREMKRRRKVDEDRIQNNSIALEMANVNILLQSIMPQLSHVCKEHELNYPSISMYEHGCDQDRVLGELLQNTMNDEADAKMLYSICQKIVCEPSFKWRCIDHNGIYNLLKSEEVNWLSEKLEHNDNLVSNTFKRLKISLGNVRLSRTRMKKSWFIYCDILGKAPPTATRSNSRGSFAVISFLKSEYGSLYKKSLIENMSAKNSTTEKNSTFCVI